MQTIFRNKKISSILTVLPEKESFFDDEVENYSFPVKQTIRLKKTMGYNKHMLAKESTTVTDLAMYGLDHMLKNNWIKDEEIGAIIVVTLCPDHFVPHNSNIIHGRLGLQPDVICLDIGQGCCGFIIGLCQAFMLLEHIDKKIILVNGDVLSHKVSHRDRNDFPLIGDAVTISIIENSSINPSIYFEMNMDGSSGDALKIPAGAFRLPSNDETRKMQDCGDGNYRSLDNMHMDGSAVFNFVQTKVPPMLEHVWKQSGVGKDEIDYFLFHQPNKFMLQKLAQKAEIPFDKIPMNIVENYGNASGACIPMVITHNYRDEMKSNQYYTCCLSAFGSGLAWGTIIMELGNMDYCEQIVSNL